MILVTGGAGFIGANFVLDWLALSEESLVNLDKLTYAGNRENLAALTDDPRHVFVHGDIGDSAWTNRLLAQYQPRAIINFAAESHVDRSIHGPEDFIQIICIAVIHRGNITNRGFPHNKTLIEVQLKTLIGDGRTSRRRPHIVQTLT